MRYGNPSIASGVEALLDAGADRIVALPLYPQGTRACAGTCLEEFERCLDAACAARGSARRPAVVEVDQYWNAPGYLDALAESVRDAWNPQGGGRLVASFHSIPLSHAKAGDTYPESTRATMEGLVSKLGMRPSDVSAAYQSRFDSRRWLGPMLAPELRRLAAEGVRDVAVVCPIFSVDCIETEFDVKEEAAEAFLSAVAENGGGDASFTYVPALGDADSIIEVLANLVLSRAF